MEQLAPTVVALLQFLLPGFLAAWVFYAFTSYRKPSEFERVIQALIFTLLTKTLTTLLRVAMLAAGKRISVGTWSEESEWLAATAIAFLLGVLFSYLANTDRFHSVVRRLGITRETSFPSEWFGAFLKNITYVVLHLKDERRLYGWPIDWPSSPDFGHFVLVQPSWLDGEEQMPITGVSCIVVSVKDVRWVEFLEKTWEKQDVQQEELQPSSSDSAD